MSAAMYAGPPTSSRSPDRIAALDELHHLAEDPAVGVAEKILRVDHLGGEVEGIVVEQNRTENGSFSFEIVRKGAFSDGDVWHQCVTAGGRWESIAKTW